MLDYSYVPKELFHREEQMQRLETLFRPLALDNRSCTAFLNGPVGTGKTVTARKFCTDMCSFLAEKNRPADVIYINCRNSSEKGALLQIIRHFDKGYPERGFSVEEMARVMSSHISTNDRSLVIILDEVDILLKRGTTDLVYQLTRARTELHSPVSVMMISQEPVDGYLDEASRSTFRRTNTVLFQRYSADELFAIVRSRAIDALVPGTFDDDPLRMISDEAAEYGDARIAIELLDRAAGLAEEESEGELTVEHVRAAKGMIFSSVPDSKLRALEINRKLVLLAVARGMKKNLTITSSSVEKTYAIACEEYGIPARKHTQFWMYLQDLEKQGIVKLNAVIDSNGKSIVVSLSDIPSKILAEKMESIIESEVEDDEVRPLRRAGSDVHKVQRHAPLPQAFHGIRGAQG